MRGIPPVKWINSQLVDTGDRVGRQTMEHAKRKCLNKERWRYCCYGYPLEGSFPEKGQGIRDLDRWISCNKNGN